jgi:hypothetical protein
MQKDQADEWAERANKAYNECLAEVGREKSPLATQLIWQYGLSPFINEQLRGLLDLACGIDDSLRTAAANIERFPFLQDVMPDALLKIQRVDEIVESLHKARQKKTGQTSWLAETKKLLNEINPKKYPANRVEITARPQSPTIAGQVQETSSPMRAPVHTDSSVDKSGAEMWRGLGEGFERLATEERSGGGHRLRATSILETNQPGDVTSWAIDRAISQKFSANYKLLGTKAGQALGVLPDSSSPLDYWLHRVYQHHCEEKSHHVRQMIGLLPSVGGTIVNRVPLGIEDLCDASTAFCLYLQKRALVGRSASKTVADCFREWIENNSSAVEPLYWSSGDSVRRWVTCVARGAKTPIPIDFFSARMNVNRLPLLLTKCEPLRAFFDQVARKEGLVWGVTQHGLWMAQQAPVGSVYVDSHGRLHGGDSTEGDERKAGQTKRAADATWSGYGGSQPLEAAHARGQAEEPKTRAQSAETAKGGEVAFTASEDYCQIKYHRKTYSLTPAAGAIVRVLYEAYMSGKVGMGSGEIKRRTKCGKVWDQFKRRDGRKFWTALITKGEKDFYKLNLEPLIEPKGSPSA